jgi:transposase-like protein
MSSCPYCLSIEVIRKGFYWVSSTRSWRRRYQCTHCKKNFSPQTTSSTYRQKKPELNEKLRLLLMSGNTLRGSARLLGCDRGTMHKKFQWLSQRQNLNSTKIDAKVIQIDEMESIEHTKLKPLTIPLCVSCDYEILGIEVARIPAKGHFASRSRKKYGPRPNERRGALEKLFKNLKLTLSNDPIEVITDGASIYAGFVRRFFPRAKHTVVLSRSLKEKKRELVFHNENKRIFDPMFALNQRCAKLRQDIRRLSRRSWCTTKKIEYLEANLKLYAEHNNALVRKKNRTRKNIKVNDSGF